jgi:hypothetical protein
MALPPRSGATTPAYVAATSCKRATSVVPSARWTSRC